MNGKAKTAQSGKPAKPVKVRNVLVQPFKIKWPEVDSDENKELLRLLENVPEEFIVSGFKPALQLLNEAQACILFITSDFHPQILGKQIIRMARRNSPSIGIIAIANLGRKGSLQKLIAIRSTATDQPNAREVISWVSKICKSKGYEEVSAQSRAAGVKEKKQKVKSGSIPEEDIFRMYLQRPDGQRAFVPEVSIFAEKTSKDTIKEDWGEFISFKRPRSEQMEIDINDLTIQEQKPFPKDAPSKPKKKKFGTYEPLTVNRIQGDPNRKTPKVKKNK